MVATREEDDGMKKISRNSAPLALLGLALFGLAGTALAAPLVIGGKPCGSLDKVRSGDTAVWKIDGCQPLTDLVNAAQPTPTPTPSSLCGNGLVDAGEVCDKGDPYTCLGKGPSACVNGCTSCSGSTVPTPTPQPTSTPPVDASCDMGVLPPLNLDGFPGWDGVRKVSIDPGQTQTWCVNLDSVTSKWTMSVIDRTGAWQCMYHTVDYIPPVGSGLKTISWKKETTNTTATWRNWDGEALPQGTYKIRITASSSFPDCPMTYEVNAHK